LGITYPQYLVLMILWETDGITVNEIAQKLILNTNTLTPLLKRMESQGIVRRQRSGQDERKVLISLTDRGREMRVQAVAVPTALLKELEHSPLTLAELDDMKNKLHRLIDFLTTG
jgi:DNA-binding MarR family transcriptional regulator